MCNNSWYKDKTLLEWYKNGNDIFLRNPGAIDPATSWLSREPRDPPRTRSGSSAGVKPCDIANTSQAHFGNSIIFPLKDPLDKWQWTLWQRMFLDTLIWRAFQLYSVYMHLLFLFLHLKRCDTGTTSTCFLHNMYQQRVVHICSYQCFVLQLVSSDSLPTSFSTVARTLGWASKRIKSSNTEVPSRSPSLQSVGMIHRAKHLH